MLAPDRVKVPLPVLVNWPPAPAITPSKTVLPPLPPVVRPLAARLTWAVVAPRPDREPTASLVSKLRLVPLASVSAEPSGTAAPFFSFSSPTVTAVAPL